MRLSTIVLVAALAPACGPATASSGSGMEIATIGAVTIKVFTYHPPGCPDPGLMLVFHGAARNAAAYRDLARPFSRRNCLVVFAPEFDRERFANRHYQRGGIVDDGEVSPRSRWTVLLVPKLVEWARSHERLAAAPCYLFGHSAGGQFLSRAAAFAGLRDVARIVIANPSSHVLPDLGENAPYGLGGVFDALESETRLREYLAQPVTIYLGGKDTGNGRLHDGPAAHRQGRNRLERGNSAYAAAAAAARARGWPLGWRIVKAPGVGHSASRMLDDPMAPVAFGLR